jgi:uncharacterized protein (DUF2249 family)
MGNSHTIQVKLIMPNLRHEQIFASLHNPKSGDALVLVKRLEPKPLDRQFEAGCSEQFSWNYLEQSPEVWRVRIGRVGP